MLSCDDAPLPVLPAADLRLGLPGYFWQDLDPQVEATMQAALARLRAAGVPLIPLDMPDVYKRQHLDPVAFAYDYMRRTGQVSHDDLRQRDPAFAAAYETRHAVAA